MTAARDFLATICAAPADDAPRLVYADWLEENGDEGRAEFIRVQCRVEATKVNDAAYMTLANRQVQLIAEQSRAFFAAPPGLRWTMIHFPVLVSGAGPFGRVERFGWAGGGAYIFADLVRRGFIEQISCTAADWLAHHQALAWHPDHCRHACPETAQPITHVRLTTFPPHEWQMANLPPDWPLGEPLGGPERYIAAGALKHVWPWLTVELLPPTYREFARQHNLPDPLPATRPTLRINDGPEIRLRDGVIIDGGTYRVTDVDGREHVLRYGGPYNFVLTVEDTLYQFPGTFSAR